MPLRPSHIFDKPPATEAQIQRAVFAHLKVRAAPGVYAFHVPNGGWRRPIEGAIFKGLGVVAGVPDVIAVREGHAYALEIKTEVGKVTAAQRLALDLLARAGATVGIGYGLDQCLAWLEQRGLLLGRST